MAIQSNIIFQVIFMSFAASTISVTIAKTKFFEGVRKYVKNKSGWLGHLINCPYCLSHYIAAILVLVYQLKAIDRIFILDYILTIFVVVAIASFWSFIICSTLLLMDFMSNGERQGFQGERKEAEQ